MSREKSDRGGEVGLFRTDIPSSHYREAGVPTVHSTVPSIVEGRRSCLLLDSGTDVASWVNSTAEHGLTTHFSVASEGELT